MGIVQHSARIVSDGREIASGWVRIADGRVHAVGDGDGWRAAMRPGDEVVDLSGIAGPGAVLTPGLVDLHVHGGAGAAHDDGADAIVEARDLHRAHGTTRAVASLVAGSLDDLVERVRAIGRVSRRRPDVLGAHLEGPFLDPGHCGAHDPALLRAPDADAIDRLLAAGAEHGGQVVRQVTIAPELPGAITAIARLRDAGVVAAVGHTGADAETTRRAVDAGATLLTHAFNAMPGIHHRRPGPIPVAAGDDRVVLELIADGVHVDDEVMRMLLRSAPGRVALITDAMSATGMPDGDYVLGALDVDVAGGVARLAGGGAIAGSTLTQDAALRRVVALGTPLVEAVAAATSVPARVLGHEGELGSLRPGAIADAALWTAGLEVARVWTAGEAV